MLSYSHSTTLILMATVFFFITTASSSAHRFKPADLALEICKNTTDFSFCKETLYSDPHIPTTDLGQVTSVIFRLSLRNASLTAEYIKAKLEEDNHYHGRVHVGNDDDDHKIAKGVLMKCLVSYDNASHVLSSMLRDFDSDTFDKFDVRSKQVQGFVRDCAKAASSKVIRGSEESDDDEASLSLSTRNVHMLNLADMCYVVSKLYHYSE